MKVRFTASGCIYSWDVDRVRFYDGDEADLDEKTVKDLLRRFPQCFKLVEVQNNKMMQGGANK